MVDEDCGDGKYCLYEIENSKCLPCIPTDMVRIQSLLSYVVVFCSVTFFIPVMAQMAVCNVSVPFSDKSTNNYQQNELMQLQEVQHVKFKYQAKTVHLNVLE